MIPATEENLPPFDDTSHVVGTTSYSIQQPVVNAPAPLYVADFNNCQPGVSCKNYSNVSVMSASTGTATGTPTWTLTGSTNMVSLSCTSCNAPRITATSAARGSCTPSVQAYYTVDGLRSKTVNLTLLSVSAVDYGSPVHSAIAYGYNSVWPFQDQDSCGTPMYKVAMHEAFPNGFSFKIDTHGTWPTPIANSWVTNENGLFTDSIGEAGSGLQPPAQSPQNPLNGTIVFDGFQYFYVNSTAVLGQTQAHYLDHGGYE